MEFLCKWLIDHPHVSVQFIYHENYQLFIYMSYIDVRISRIVELNHEKDFIEIILNEMYNKLISKGGSI